MVDLVVSNILPYPRSLYLLRFSISGNFITVKSLVNGFGVPGPWHSLHNASVYRLAIRTTYCQHPMTTRRSRIGAT